MSAETKIILAVILVALLIAWIAFEYFARKRRKLYKTYRDMVRSSFDDWQANWAPQRESVHDDAPWPERDFSGELGKPRWTDGGVAHRQSRDPAYTCYTPWHGESKQDFKVHKLQCDNCGSPLTVIDGKRLAACTFCNSQYYLENFDPELEDYPPPRKTSWSTYWVDGGVSIRSIWKEKHD